MGRKYRNHIMTHDSVTIFFDDGRVIPMSAAHSDFRKVVAALDAGDFDEVTNIVDAETRIARESAGKIQIECGSPVVDGEILPTRLSARLMAFVKQGVNCDPLINFWRLLRTNPSDHVKECLFDFLDHNSVPLTVDGHFIGFRRVQDDYMDAHTGKFDNHPGKWVSMRREDCDPDPHETCSRGLHIATFRYADKFYANGILLECKVPPQDVVAVPFEYGAEKLRVCRYHVIMEAAGPREELVYPDDESYWVEEDDADPSHISNGGTVVATTKPRQQTGSEGSEDGDGVVRSSLKIGANRRLLVTSPLLEKLGADNGDIVYVSTSGGVIFVSMEQDGDGTELKVDKYRNMQISASIVTEAGLDDSGSLRGQCDGELIRIEA